MPQPILEPISGPLAEPRRPRLGAPRGQRGMTFLGLVLALAVAAFAALTVAKVVPLYLEAYKVRSVLRSLAEDPGLARAPVREVREKLLRRLDINDVEHVGPEAVQVERHRGVTRVSVAWEARVPLFANLDLVARFPHNEVELRGGGDGG